MVTAIWPKVCKQYFLHWYQAKQTVTLTGIASSWSSNQVPLFCEHCTKVWGNSWIAIASAFLDFFQMSKLTAQLSLIEFCGIISSDNDLHSVKSRSCYDRTSASSLRSWCLDARANCLVATVWWDYDTLKQFLRCRTLSKLAGKWHWRTKWRKNVDSVALSCNVDTNKTAKKWILGLRPNCAWWGMWM